MLSCFCVIARCLQWSVDKRHMLQLVWLVHQHVLDHCKAKHLRQSSGYKPVLPSLLLQLGNTTTLMFGAASPALYSSRQRQVATADAGHTLQANREAELMQA